MKGSFKTLSDIKLLRGLDDLVAKSRQNEADLLAYLAEVDRRELYLEQGCSSMFGYCTEVLHFSEATAFRRIAVARAARTHPLLLERIREGALHVAGAKLLAPTLTPENHAELLDLARHKSKRAIERILADRAPKPDVPARIRQLPNPRAVPAVRVAPETAKPACEVPSLEGDFTQPLQEASNQEAAPSPPESRAPTPAPSPLGGGRFRVQFTGSQALCDKLREAQALLRHQIPDGDMAEIFERALTLLVQDANRKRFAQTSGRRRSKAARQSGAASRHIPAKIKRAVCARDGGRCAFVGVNGRPCGSRDFLEFHHLDPWARTKRHSTEGIELRCRGHNRYGPSRTMGARTWPASQGETTPHGASAMSGRNEATKLGAGARLRSRLRALPA